jgi:hypothetical protein
MIGRMISRGTLWGLTVLATLATSMIARADRIAMEAYVGDRPANAERVLAPIRPVLERHGFVATPGALAKRFAAHAWRSGGVRTVGLQIFKKVEDGIREFEDAKLSAANTLKDALALAGANPTAWVNEPKYRERVRRGLLFYALALNLRAKDGRDRASRVKGKKQSDYIDRANADERARDEALAELIRSFPGFVVRADEFGAQAEALFLEASRRALQRGTGSLELDVDDPSVIVYVNEAQQPRKTTLGNLVAGEYRVLAVSATESHEYQVDVVPNKRSRVVVKWGLDSVLKLDGWAGFAYRAEHDREQEQELLSALVRASGAVDVAATLSVKSDGSAVIARSYDLQRGKSLASCTLPSNRKPDRQAMDRFARCLTGEDGEPAVASGAREADSRPTAQPAGGAIVDTSATRPAPVIDHERADTAVSAIDDASDAPSPRSTWKLWGAVTSFGVAAVAGGVAGKFALDAGAAGDELDRLCADRCTSQEAKAIIADQTTARHRALFLAGVSGAAVVGGAVLLVLWHRSGHSAATPTAQIGAGGASVGWSVEF